MKRKKNCHIIRMDPVGRIVLPTQIRSAMFLDGRTELAVEIDDEKGELRMRPSKNRCLNCGAEIDLHRLGAVVLCGRCIEELKNG